jgi:hypothetical protein
MEQSRVCCLNVMWNDNIQVDVFRNPIYTYEECLKWPPANCKELLCQHCCLKPESNPVPMCIEYEKKTDTYFCQGFFCSFACAKAYILDSFRFTAGEPLLFLDHLAFNAFGHKADIIPAPPRNRLKMFGGDLSVAEFRSGVATMDVQLTRPITSAPLLYERHTVVQPTETKKHKKTHSESIEKYSDSGATLYDKFIQNNSEKEVGSVQIQASGTKTGTLSAFMKKK